MTRVRFAPSPTGKLHLGSARTAVFNWLYARHCGGQFVLRIEDTDRKRSQDEYIDSILHDMEWMGLNHEEFYRQSERFEIYREYVLSLIEMGKAYYCTCSKDDLIARNRARGITDEITKYDGHCRDRHEKPEASYVIRLNLGEERDIIFKDLVRKRIRVNTKELDDFVLWKSDDSPTYNFAVVIDDALMKISHIIRGEDHITNTAKQIILYRYLDFEEPVWAHLPLVFDKDRSPLSKRKGSTNIEDYRKKGILPEALINYIARLGWSHGDEEIFSLEQLIEYYDVDKLNRSNAVYDEEKMQWVNGKHLKMQEPALIIEHMNEYIQENGLEYEGKMKDPEWLSTAVDALRERNSTLDGLFHELKDYASAECVITPEAEKKLAKLESDEANIRAFDEVYSVIRAISDFSKLDDLEGKLRSIAERHSVKFGSVAQMLRIRLTGKTVSPDIISVIKILGKEAANRLS